MSAETLTFDDLSRVFVRTTERSAIAAWSWIGRGDRSLAIEKSNDAMIDALRGLPVDGKVMYWGESLEGEISNGQRVGANGSGMIVDVVVNSIENRRAMHTAGPGSLSVIGAAPGGTILDIGPTEYVEMLVAGRHSADQVDPNKSIKQNIEIVAKSLNKAVEDMSVFVFNHPANDAIVEEIHRIGCRVRHRGQGELVGAVCAADEYAEIDIFAGVTRAHHALLSSVAVNGLRGVLYARCAPQSEEEREAVKKHGLDLERWYTNKDFVQTKWTIFCATGITDNVLVEGVKNSRGRFTTQTMVIGGESAYQRIVSTKHRRTESF